MHVTYIMYIIYACLLYLSGKTWVKLICIGGLCSFASFSGSSTRRQVDAACGADKPCRYDYMITLRKQVALNTLQEQEWVQEQVQNAKPGR